MEHMEIYNRVRAVPMEAQKAFSNGSFQGTDINPQWRIQMLTEMFGICGLGWKYEIVEHWNEEINREIHTHVRINLYVSVDGIWSEAIPGIGGNKSLQQFKTGPKSSDEGYKMALTDALSVACKALGIGADIYFAEGKTKYTVQTQNINEDRQAQAKEAVQSDVLLITALNELSKVTSREELKEIAGKYTELKGSAEFVKALHDNPYYRKNK